MPTTTKKRVRALVSKEIPKSISLEDFAEEPKDDRVRRKCWYSEFTSSHPHKDNEEENVKILLAPYEKMLGLVTKYPHLDNFIGRMGWRPENKDEICFEIAFQFKNGKHCPIPLFKKISDNIKYYTVSDIESARLHC